MLFKKYSTAESIAFKKKKPRDFLRSLMSLYWLDNNRESSALLKYFELLGDLNYLSQTIYLNLLNSDWTWIFTNLICGSFLKSLT